MMSCKKNTQRINIKIPKDEKVYTQVQRTASVRNRVLRDDGRHKPCWCGSQYGQVTHSFLLNREVYWNKKCRERSQEERTEHQRHHWAGVLEQGKWLKGNHHAGSDVQ